MSQGTNHQDLLAQWQRCIEDGVEAWKATLPQTAAALHLWGQAVGQGTETWSRLIQHDTGTAEAMAQWKKLMDDSVERWSKLLADTMTTEAFAAAMGRSLEQWLNAVGPLRKNLHTASEEALGSLNLPSRQQVTRLAASVVAVEERVEALEDRLESMEEHLKAVHEQLARVLDRLPAEAARAARRPRASRERKRRPEKAGQG